MRPGYLVLLFSFLTCNIFSQDIKEKFFFTGFQSHYGFIIPHTSAIEPVSHTNPYGLELSFSKINTSYESWKVFHRYNISGIQLAWYNFQNPRIVGSAYALSFFTEPVLGKRGKFLFSIKAGGGFSYQTKIHDYVTDSLNKFFSTRISFPLHLSVRFKYMIFPQTFLTISGNYNHISNGAMRIPNFGMNFPTASLGLEYFPGSFPDISHVYTEPRDVKKTDQYIHLQILGGYKYVYGEPVKAFGASVRYTRQLRTFYALNGGFELLMDGGVKRMVKIRDLSVDYKRFALTAGQDFFLGKIIFTQYIGIYLYSPYKAKRPVYQKYELSYRLKPDFNIGCYLQAYTSEADLFGISLNYHLHL